MTSRRNFFKNIVVAGAAFAILPGAGRIWKATAAPLVTVDSNIYLNISHYIVKHYTDVQWPIAPLKCRSINRAYYELKHAKTPTKV